MTTTPYGPSFVVGGEQKCGEVYWKATVIKATAARTRTKFMGGWEGSKKNSHFYSAC